MTEKPEKTTSQVIREGEKVAKKNRRVAKAKIDVVPSINGQKNWGADVSEEDVAKHVSTHVGLEEQLEAEGRAQKAEDARKNATVDYELTGKSDVPAGWGERSDRSLSPTSSNPNEWNTLPSEAAEKLPFKGLSMGDGTNLYTSTGGTPHPADSKRRPSDTRAEEHLKNAASAHANGDIASLAVHKQKLHSLYRKGGQPYGMPSLCKNDNCGNTVGFSDYDKSAVGESVANDMEFREVGDVPCRSCYAQGRD